MTRRFSLVLALAAFAACSAAYAGDNNEATKQNAQTQNAETTLGKYLSEIGWEPTLDEYKKLGGEEIVASLLIKAAKDETLKLYIRIRALHALAAFPANASATNALKDFLKPGNKAVLRRAAAFGLANALGEKAVPSLEPLAADDDPLVREGAAIALSRIPSKSAEALLVKMLKSETHPIALDTISMALYVWKKTFSQ